MDPLSEIASLLNQRDSLEESVRYAAPEEVSGYGRQIERVMRRVVYLMGLVDWVQA